MNHGFQTIYKKDSFRLCIQIAYIKKYEKVIKMDFGSTDQVNSIDASKERLQNFQSWLHRRADISAADITASDLVRVYFIFMSLFLFFTSHQSPTIHICFRAKHIKVNYRMKKKLLCCDIWWWILKSLFQKGASTNTIVLFLFDCFYWGPGCEPGSRSWQVAHLDKEKAVSGIPCNNGSPILSYSFLCTGNKVCFSKMENF